MARPSIKSPCVADRYADKRNERIAEFVGGNGVGGLISIKIDDTGKLFVHLYRLDPNVTITIGK